LLVIVEILVPQGDPEHPLADECPYRVLDPLRLTLVDKAARQSIDQSDRFVGALQQQCSGIGADRAAVKRRHHSTAFNA
jgi:hypothetical protein